MELKLLHITMFHVYELYLGLGIGLVEEGSFDADDHKVMHYQLIAIIMGGEFAPRTQVATSCVYVCTELPGSMEFRNMRKCGV